MNRANAIVLLRLRQFVAIVALAFAIVSGRAVESNEAVTKELFGRTDQGDAIDIYTLKNRNGITAKVMTYGATLVELRTPDRSGDLVDVVLGFDTLEGYLRDQSYFGATVGRYANRIARGRFTLDGREYVLATNNGPNHLHGGRMGFHRQIWRAAPAHTDRGSAVVFTRTSPDGEEGYPGNLFVTVTYALTDGDELKISYEATTDKPTPVNLTNHSYFNLRGAGDGDVREHVLQIDADAFTPVDDTLIPTGRVESVADTPMDFRRPHTIRSQMNLMTAGTSTRNPPGFDINLVLRPALTGEVRLVATLYEPDSGRIMSVLTDQPGLQLYTGNYLGGSLTGKEGKAYRRHYGLCLESQHFPDSVNRPNFPATILRPGKVYRTTTVLKFSTR